MTGAEHYEHAEQLLDMAGDDELGSDQERYRLAKAQVHATLALAAATATPAIPGTYGRRPLSGIRS